MRIVGIFLAGCMWRMSHFERDRNSRKELQRRAITLISGGAEWQAGAGDLAADQAGVEPPSSEELVVAAGLDEMAAVEHGEEIGVAHGR